jgi:hypothetical protein
MLQRHEGRRGKALLLERRHQPGARKQVGRRESRPLPGVRLKAGTGEAAAAALNSQYAPRSDTAQQHAASVWARELPCCCQGGGGRSMCDRCLSRLLDAVAHNNTCMGGGAG